MYFMHLAHEKRSLFLSLISGHDVRSADVEHDLDGQHSACCTCGRSHTEQAAEGKRG